MTPVAIIGGGISGLAAAQFLRKRGIRSVVIEPDAVLGGALRTESVAGCTVEAGADSWLAAKPWARELATELGLAGEIIGSNDAMRKVQVLRRGKLVPFPSGMELIVPRRLSTVWTSPLFGFTTKLWMTADRFRHDAGPRDDRSVAAFVRDHFGNGAVRYLAEPLLSGIYGGDPEVLSARSVLPKLTEREQREGSLTRGARAAAVPGGPVFESMRGGLGQLIAALEPKDVIRGAAETLRRNSASWQVRVDGSWLEAAEVVLACPAYQASRILRASHEELSGLLGQIRYSSTHIVAMAFRDLPPLGGFGILVPKAEGHNLTAATWVTTKFLGRAPRDVQLIRAFFRHPSPDPVEELRRITRFRAKPLFLRNYPWPNSLPQYAVGHGELVKSVEAFAARTPGLNLIGNAYHGVGIPDCVRLAREAASRIASTAPKALQ